MANIKIFPGLVSWEETERQELAEFLFKTTGQRLLSSLFQMRPTVSGSDPEKRRIASDEKAGYESCIADILTLADKK